MDEVTDLDTVVTSSWRAWAAKGGGKDDLRGGSGDYVQGVAVAWPIDTPTIFHALSVTIIYTTAHCSAGIAKPEAAKRAPVSVRVLAIGVIINH